MKADADISHLRELLDKERAAAKLALEEAGYENAELAAQAAHDREDLAGARRTLELLR